MRWSPAWRFISPDLQVGFSGGSGAIGIRISSENRCFHHDGQGRK
jgi:hypothetical protein